MEQVFAMGSNRKPLSLRPGDALIVLDVQNDLLPGGALGVPEGDQVVPVLNEYLQRFVRRGWPVFATRNWHPADHCSFHAAGGPWPPHCIADSAGARFAPDLALPHYTRVISKGIAREPVAYSGFAGTDLAVRLRHAGARRLFAGGLATDYAVLDTVKDALAAGYPTVVLVDAVRAVDVEPGDGTAALAEMERLGASMARLEDLGS